MDDEMDDGQIDEGCRGFASQAHVPARVRFEEGRLVARPVRSMGSGHLAAHAQANALVVLDAGRKACEAGETAEALLLGRFLEDDGAPI